MACRELEQWADEPTSRRADEATTRQADEAVTGDQRAAAWQSRHPQLIAWSIEFYDLWRRYPSPRLSKEVRDLMRARTLRMLRGEAVASERGMRWSGQRSRRHTSGRRREPDRRERSLTMEKLP